MSRRLASIAARMKTGLKKDELIKTWRIYRGDKVIVLKGKDKGKISTVTEVLRTKNSLVLEGLNLVKKHVKSTGEAKGGIFTQEAPLHYSKVALLDPTTNGPTKVAFRFLEDGQKVRISKKSGVIIPRPEILKERKKPKPMKDGPKDTAPEAVLRKTYDPEKENFPFLRE
eukprot:TRINITY_DN2977_c0_g1_i1.p1 TRINITY_DN2977_c0_g1~~TRINITY_DN2977_c0_g1_i1.p1  ORF type:complete len:170 (-),score=37.83 TRINITY_DN2977_c0_g1_i1:82-591(-)